MSLLTPLYVLGLLAVSLPFVFHLIRRMPKGQFHFGSLMFLSPSPPRLTRRSRLDHWLLLLLRALALGLLAFAFARPFLRHSEPTDAANGSGRRLAVVVDTSASMRRGDLWQQALAAADSVLAEGGPIAEVAILSCDDRLRPIIGFEEMAAVSPTLRRGLVKNRLAQLKPTWAGTHLGRGLADAVEMISNLPRAKEDAGSHIDQRIVLITDLQAGSRLDVLADYPWPEDVELELRPLKPPQNTNAGLHRLAEHARDQSPGKSRNLRVRVSNDTESAVDQFRLTWLRPGDIPIGKPIAAYVPAGESRVVGVPRPNAAPAGIRLHLSGDGCDFDNSLYLAARPELNRSVVYLGTDAANDPQQLRYYLHRALSDGMSQPVELRAVTAETPLAFEPSPATPLVVVTTEPTTEQTRKLSQYASAGGTLLFVLMNAKPSPALATLLNVEQLAISEAKVNKYAMLGQIAFDHPLFAPMAGPQFNDFTQIIFWKYRQLNSDQLGDTTIVARFENGDPAVLDRRVGKGRIIVFASGWQPSDSQLARSWKFVLLVSALVDGTPAAKADRVYFAVNEPVPLGDDLESSYDRSITKPDGETTSILPNAGIFKDADQPGIYKINIDRRVSSPALIDDNVDEVEPRVSQTFAVNLDPVESATGSLAVESLEQLGCRLVTDAAVVENAARQRQLRDVQIEGRQKLWQWLIVAALAVLVAETWLAGRATKISLAKAVSA